MKKLIAAALALSTLLFVGCGGDDDDPPPPPGPITITAGTGTAPAIPLVPHDAAWNAVTATTIPLATNRVLPVSPMRTPTGPSKALSAPSTVAMQAIKSGGHLFLRFQWLDLEGVSMERDNWAFDTLQAGFNFRHRTQNGEDQLWVSFAGMPDNVWDTWNWRVLTTAQVGRAEDGRTLDKVTTWDDGANPSAYPNSDNDPARPVKIHETEWAFEGDILLLTETIPSQQGVGGEDNWYDGQKVPGWFINDLNVWAEDTTSRWDVWAAYDFDASYMYTVVMVRDLTTGQLDDLDLAEISRATVRIGVFDDYDDPDWTGGNTRRAFSADFWLVLP